MHSLYLKNGVQKIHKSINYKDIFKMNLNI